MAAHIPAKLKAADLTRFCVRASQLETAKPVVAYWCEYWIVNQILSKGLHNGDNETLQYTTNLMDKLEQIKAENATNDAIVDDTAGQAYVEQFALETFNRADRAVQANKVTKQTADTFQAASTFFELVNIWGPPDAETQAKVKYAKWNAVRIAKALKEGKDPNESNPRPQIQEEETLPTLDPDDPDVLRIGGPDKPEKPRQASVEEVPDEQDHIDRRMARQSSIDQSLHPSAQVSARGSPAGTFEPYPRNGFPYNAVQDDNVSPLEPSPNDRNGSIGGGYFPEVPTFTSQSRDSTLPTAPLDDVIDLGLPEQPSVAPGSGPAPDFESFPPPRTLDDEPSAQDYYTAPPPVIKAPSPPFQPPPHPHTQLPTPQFQQPPPTQIQAPRQPLHPQQPQYQGPPPVPQTQPHNQNYNPGLQPRYPHHPNPPPAQSQSFAPATPTPMAAPRNYGKEQLITDDVAIAKAQKHARWAISALNFEDAETAVRELRDALRTLGAAA